MLDKLIALKRIYGDFFVLPERVFRMMKSEIGASASPITACSRRRRSPSAPTATQGKVHDGAEGGLRPLRVRGAFLHGLTRGIGS